MASTLRAWASAWSHCRLASSPDLWPLGGASPGGASIKSLSPSSPILLAQRGVDLLHAELLQVLVAGGVRRHRQARLRHHAVDDQVGGAVPFLLLAGAAPGHMREGGVQDLVQQQPVKAVGRERRGVFRIDVDPLAVGCRPAAPRGSARCRRAAAAWRRRRSCRAACSREPETRRSRAGSVMGGAARPGEQRGGWPSRFRQFRRAAHQSPASSGSRCISSTRSARSHAPEIC